MLSAANARASGARLQQLGHLAFGETKPPSLVMPVPGLVRGSVAGTHVLLATLRQAGRGLAGTSRPMTILLYHHRWSIAPPRPAHSVCGFAFWRIPAPSKDQCLAEGHSPARAIAPGETKTGVSAKRTNRAFPPSKSNACAMMLQLHHNVAPPYRRISYLRNGGHASISPPFCAQAAPVK